MTAARRVRLASTPVFRARQRGYDRFVRTDSARGRLVLDLAICAALFAIFLPVTMQPDAPDGAGAGTVLDSLLLPTVILPILLRRRAPFTAAALLAAGCVVSGFPTFDQFRLGAAIPAAMLILYSLACGAERPRALGGLALVLAGMLFIGFTDVVLEQEGGVVAMVLFSFPLCAGVWGAGRMVRSREELAAQLAERSRLLDRQREQTAQLAVEVERTRLASDHDAAARVRVREIIELADSGERAVAADRERGREAFARIERIGRESLNELRGLLVVLRSDERGTRAPRPTLAELETLPAEARAGGRLVDLEVEGERRPLPRRGAGGLPRAPARAGGRPRGRRRASHRPAPLPAGRAGAGGARRRHRGRRRRGRARGRPRAGHRARGQLQRRHRGAPAPGVARPSAGGDGRWLSDPRSGRSRRVAGVIPRVEIGFVTLAPWWVGRQVGLRRRLVGELADKRASSKPGRTRSPASRCGASEPGSPASCTTSSPIIWR
jgi:hypothetical protein